MAPIYLSIVTPLDRGYEKYCFYKDLITGQPDVMTAIRKSQGGVVQGVL